MKKQHVLQIIISILLIGAGGIIGYNVKALHDDKLNRNLIIQTPVPSGHPKKEGNKGSAFNSVYKFGLDIPFNEKYIELPIRPSSPYKQEIWLENTAMSGPYAWIDMEIKVSEINPELSTLRPKDFYYYKSKPYQLGIIPAKIITVGRGDVFYYYVVAKIGNYYLQIDQRLAPNKKFDELLSTFRYFGNEVTIKLNAKDSVGKDNVGTAVLTDLGNEKTKIVIQVESMAGKDPANIYTGSCSKLGPIKYPLTQISNGLKTNSAPGKSEAVLNISLDTLRSQFPLAIGVQSTISPRSLDWCGDVN